MSRMTSRLAAAGAALVLGVLGANMAFAQATTTSSSETVNFEVLSVSGNSLVVRNQKGIFEYTVPDSFRFTVNGQPKSVHELSAGMKGTAVVTTTTTVKPVFVTEVRNAEVLGANKNVVTVQNADGVRRFNQAELDAMNVSITVNGKVSRVRDLKRGDRLTATLISRAPPEVLTDTQVKAVLAEPDTPAPVTMAAPTATAGTPATTPAVEAAPAAEEPAAEAPAEVAAAPAEEPAVVAAVVEEETSHALWWWLLAVLVVAVLAWILFGDKKKKA
jgi:hypothetical protein